MLALFFLATKTQTGALITSQNITQSSQIKIKKVKACKKGFKKRQKAASPVSNEPTGLITKSIRNQNVAELGHNLKIYLRPKTSRDYFMIVKYLEALINKSTDPLQIRDYRLQLADVYYETEKYAKAGSVYTQYYESYPGYHRAEYALFQAIMAKFKQIGACDQDNTITNEILELSQQYLQNKSYEKYQQQVTALFEACNNQTLESEIKVFEHYFRQGLLDSAQRRVDYMRDKMLDKATNAKDRIQDLQNLLDQAKTGKNTLKLLKKFRNAQKNQLKNAESINIVSIELV